MKLKQYIRDDVKGQPFGIMVADKTDTGIRFGWSMTHPNDKFNKALGEKIANNRLEACEPDQMFVVPTAMVEELNVFINRAKKYFRVNTESVAIDGYALAESVHRASK